MFWPTRAYERALVVLQRIAERREIDDANIPGAGATRLVTYRI